ncbi:hypothetical protein, partial [Vibrio parahaemolyticus]|uniref:hypothetical protein n=1 Tax=Vibrio parahaemolyticus TaxID=670 RepID=UPI001A8DA5E0
METPITLDAVDMEGFDVILGFPWLKHVNPLINWQERTWAFREGKRGEDVIVIPEKKVRRA